MDTDATPRRRIGAMIAAAAACVAVALPVSGAFAQDDESSKQRTTPDAQSSERPRDGDCPEKDGNSGSDQNRGSSSSAQSGDTLLQ